VALNKTSKLKINSNPTIFIENFVPGSELELEKADLP
jgi:hypothetical protein